MKNQNISKFTIFKANIMSWAGNEKISWHRIYTSIIDSLKVSCNNFKSNFRSCGSIDFKYNFKLYFFNAIIAFCIFHFRKSDSLINSQLWAEDGVIFLKSEWVTGFPETIFIPYAGYLHFVPRLIAFIANLFPFEIIPFIFNFMAMTIAAISVSLFSLVNYRYLVKSDFLRTVIVILICFVPVGYESINNVTNVHFFLSFGFFLLALIGGELSGVSYFFIFVYSLLAIFSAPLTIFYLPFYLIRFFSCKSDRYSRLYGIIFILGITYGIAIYLTGAKREIAPIDWSFLMNVMNVEKLIRISFLGYLGEENTFSALSYVKYFWILEIVLLYFFCKNFVHFGIGNTFLILGYMIAIFVPILLRGAFVISDEQALLVKLTNGSKDSIYFLNVVKILSSRYGLVPYFIFCIIIFSYILPGKISMKTSSIMLILFVSYLHLIKNSVFIKHFEELNWDSYSKQVRNKEDISIPINPKWYTGIHIRKDEWR